MVPKGVAMLLKSMGLDAEMITAQLTEAGSRFGKTIEHFNKRLDIIDSRLANIEKKLGVGNVVTLTHEGNDHGKANLG